MATVLLIHGALVDARVWKPVLDALPGTLSVVVPQFAGVFPDTDLAEFGAEHHVQQLEGLLPALARPLIVVGHSRGGRLALELARRQGWRIDALVVAEAGGIMEEVLVPNAGWKVAGALNEAVALLAAGRRREAARSYIESGHGAGSFDGLPELVRQCAVDNIHTLPAMLADRSVPLTRRMFREIACSTTLVEASGSPPIFAAIADAAVGENPRFVRHTLDGFDHFFPFRAPDAFARVIAACTPAAATPPDGQVRY